jgi:hypothetical protein
MSQTCHFADSSVCVMMASAAVGPTMTFQTVFDVAREGYGAWWFPAIGLVFVLVGGLFVLNPTLAILAGIWGPPKKLFGWVFLGFSVLWTVMTFAITYNEYTAAATALKEERYSIAEGPWPILLVDRNKRALRLAIVRFPIQILL